MWRKVLFALELTRQDYMERFGGSALGSLWVFIWPLVQLFIYLIIFGKFMGGRLPGNSAIYAYGIYLASGLIAWTSFANTLTRTSRMFIDKRHIITKVRIHLLVFPLFICLSETVPFLFSVFALSLVAIASGWGPGLGDIALICFVYYVIQVFAASMGLICAIFTIFLKDLSEVVSISIQLWFWFTPIVYVKEILPAWAQGYLALNPVAHLIGAMREVYGYGNGLDWQGLLLVASAAHALLGLSLFLQKRLERDIRDFL